MQIPKTHLKSSAPPPSLRKQKLALGLDELPARYLDRQSRYSLYRSRVRYLCEATRLYYKHIVFIVARCKLPLGYPIRERRLNSKRAGTFEQEK